MLDYIINYKLVCSTIMLCEIGKLYKYHYLALRYPIEYNNIYVFPK